MKPKLKYLYALAAILMLCGCGGSRKYPEYDEVARGAGWYVYQINDTTLLYVSSYSTQPPQIVSIGKGGRR
ncbi:MAG: hypothetical protein K2N48_01365 [Muribaculaceae bacterium]|nr:hypothetical protein [Muribaculaceae bacterium]